MVEEEEGAFGLWATYLLAGVGGTVASYLSAPHSHTVSLGASGAVFGLFMVRARVRSGVAVAAADTLRTPWLRRAAAPPLARPRWCADACLPVCAPPPTRARTPPQVGLIVKFKPSLKKVLEAVILGQFVVQQASGCERWARRSGARGPLVGGDRRLRSCWSLPLPHTQRTLRGPPAQVLGEFVMVAGGKGATMGGMQVGHGERGAGAGGTGWYGGPCMVILLAPECVCVPCRRHAPYTRDGAGPPWLLPRRARRPPWRGQAARMHPSLHPPASARSGPPGGRSRGRAAGASVVPAARPGGGRRIAGSARGA